MKKTLQRVVKRYTSPTPDKWRKISDFILAIGTTMTSTFAGMEVHKGWVIGASILTALGTAIPKLFTEDEKGGSNDESNQEPVDSDLN